MSEDFTPGPWVTVPAIAEPITLRDWFAGQVISGRITGIALHNERMEGMAKQVYDLADAMLAERARKS